MPANYGLKLFGLVSSATMFLGCSLMTSVTPKLATSPAVSTVTPSPSPSTAPTAAPQLTAVTLTMKEGSSANPVGPEDLSSVVIDGVTIPASQIEFRTTAYKTQAETSAEYQVAYEGAGKYYVLNKTTGKVLENRALIVFNLLNSKGSMVLPILQGILDNNLQMTIDLATSNIFGGIKKEDGSLDSTQAVFKIGTDGKMTVTEPSGKQTEYGRNDSNVTNLPAPDKVVELSSEEVKAQISEIASEVPATSPIATYAGLWLYQGLGNKLIAQLKDVGDNKFTAGVKIDGTDYSGQGAYSPTGKIDSLMMDVATDDMKFEIKHEGTNYLSLTIKSTSNEKYKTFQNAPIFLDRVRVVD